ncbi:unnamed protein product [Cuscuta epithymum]|uniref:F-box domain-containing protein n=1 Tax=Cuscuta epithymum TaxID=186058 RepID=A0AAV0FW66_9ASTE|nr:unnamed protein product [Cuscuta epithymum]CAH9139939.1 unnamed protein product [Cuscuta epithymum]
MENCKLPTDLLINILARLPVKPLMRFKSVSKYFYDLIKSDLHFMHKHYEISKTKPEHAVIESGSDKRKVVNLLYKESEFYAIGCRNLDIPLSVYLGIWHVKCLYGMLCLIVGREDPFYLQFGKELIYDIVIWNPSTKEIKSLPPLKVPFKHPHNSPNEPPIRFVMNDGFGFGLCKNMTWKIVCVWNFEFYKDNVFHGIVMVGSQVGDSWCWREIDAKNITGVDLYMIEDFYLKGRYYWRVMVQYPALSTYDRERLLWFDMDDEIFGILELPSHIGCGLVTPMNETIAFLGYPILANNYQIEIWLMHEDDNHHFNWHKHTSIDSRLYPDEHPIGIWNHHLLLIPPMPQTDSFTLDANFVPSLISSDLITGERDIMYVTEERKNIDIAYNSSGCVRVNFEGNVQIPRKYRIFHMVGTFVRVYHESLYLP